MAIRESLERKSFRTVGAKIHLAREGMVKGLTRDILRTTVSGAGVAVEEILNQLKAAMKITKDEAGILKAVDLVFPCHQEDRERATLNANKPRRIVPEFIGKTKRPPTPKEQATPQYKNAYHLEEVIDDGFQKILRFRVAEAFIWKGTRGKLRDVTLRDVQLIDATLGLQQLIMSWLRPSLAQLPKVLRSGVCQQAAQQFLSHLGLLDYQGMPKVSYPSLENRDPRKRQELWQEAVRFFARKTEPLTQEKAKNLYPGKYEDDDERGENLVTTDPEWLAFASSPFPGRLPLNFVGSQDVIVYERNWRELVRGELVARRRLYAALPLFRGVAPDSALGVLAQNRKNFWWRTHIEEFTPLPVFVGNKLEEDDELLLVVLECDPPRLGKNRPSRFEDLLSGRRGREINWSLLVEKRRSRNPRRGQPEWYVYFVTSRTATVQKRPLVLGIHLDLEPIVWWALADRHGKILEEGQIKDNIILTAGLDKKLQLEEIQGKLLWEGDRRFAEELKRRTYEVGRAIVRLAVDKNANLAVENINWVDKRTGGPEANRRFSMWNYAKLRQVLEDIGLDWQKDGEDSPVLTVAKVSDYLLRFTCPRCGACRKAGQEQEKATTWFEKGTLHCRRCGFAGIIPHRHQARLVAKMGLKNI